MKKITLIVFMLTCFGQAYAASTCEDIQTKIAANIDAKGVKNYSLMIVSNDKAGSAKIVGSCDGGSKKIVYARKKP